MDMITISGYIFSAITATAGWLAGTRMRRNQAIQALQDTINMLSKTIEEDKKKIVDLMNEIQEVRRENAELKAGQKELLEQIESLKAENRELNELVRANNLPQPKPKKNIKTKNTEQ